MKKEPLELENNMRALDVLEAQLPPLIEVNEFHPGYGEACGANSYRSAVVELISRLRQQ